jgi:hypothetical protein
MCGAREGPFDALEEDINDKLEALIKEVMERADKIMTEDPDCQPYKTPDAQQLRLDAIESIEQTLSVIKSDLEIDLKKRFGGKKNEAIKSNTNIQ